jgi:hypothetical protein
MPLIFHSKPLNSASFRKKTLRPFLRCVCASQKSFFRRQTFASQHKSGGRKPPVVREATRSRVSQFCNNQARVQPRAAGVSQPWFWKHARSGWIAIVAQRRPVGGLCTNTVAIALPYHGGLTPAALESSSRYSRDICSLCTVRAAQCGPRRADARRSVHVRLCIARIVLFAGRQFRIAHKSARRKPPTAG